MRTFVIVRLVLLYGTALSMAMYMPEDTELLDGYILDDGHHDQISPEDMYFELRSLTGHARRPIRNKRDAKYEVLQSEGLASHFLPKIAFKKPQMVDIIGTVHRLARSVDVVEKPKLDKLDKTAETDRAEKLPIAEKQTQMDRQRYAPADQTVFASDMVDRWTTAPFEYTKLQRQNSDDALGQNNGVVKEGGNGRTPRVHFVTQQKKQPPAEDKFTMMMMGDDLNVASANKADSYKNARTERLEEDSRGYMANRYSDYDTYNNRRYDRYDMALPPYMRSLDYMPMPRTPIPHQMDFYYGYPERRFDLPDFRDNRNLYSNDINERYPIAMDMKPPRNRRIIYYATLPEIVRTPPSVDLRYRTYDTRYDYAGYPPYNPFYRPSSIAAGGASTGYGVKSGALKTDRNPNVYGKRDGVGQVQIAGALTVKDAPSNAIKAKVIRRDHDLDRYY